MGRRKKNAVHGFYNYDKNENTSTCLVKNCEMILKGCHATNLLYHLKSRHKEELRIVTRRNKMLEEESQLDDVSGTSTDEPIVKSMRTSNETIDYLSGECLKLVTVHGRPFALMDDLAFRNILNLININPEDFKSINSHTIRALVSETAIEKRQLIADELKTKLFALKIDYTTYSGRKFIGINAQFIKNAKIYVRNLGVIELNECTEEYLKDRILDVLRKYNITVQQIYSITSDGSNMTKLKSNSHTDSDDENGSENKDDIENINVTLNDELEPAHSVSSIHCAGNILQLSIADALLNVDVAATLEEARSIVRYLRSPCMTIFFKRINKKLPVLDCASEWYSTFDMLDRLVLLQNCWPTDVGDLHESDIHWDAIADLIKSLMPAKTLNETLQSEQLTIGDFYYHWTKCQLETVKIIIPFAQKIYDSMESQKLKLMENLTFLSAIYLDLRFQVILSDEQMKLAVQHLQSIWMQLVCLGSRSHYTSSSPEFIDTTIVKIEDQMEDEMEMLLAEVEREKRRDTSFVSVINIKRLLEDFCLQPRLNSKVNILEFWKEKKLTYPQLFSLATTVLATPSTHFSFRQLFSSLKFVLKDLQYNFLDKIVEDILVIRNN